MENKKKEILKSLIPRAVLLPVNEKTKKTISNKNIISIKNFPFKIGRESRVEENERGFFVKLRIFNGDSAQPSNDMYLIDNDEFLQISKQHLEISMDENSYIVRDRGSMNGTTINGETIGGDRQTAQKRINDGDIIQIGSDKSDYKFQFLTLDI